MVTARMGTETARETRRVIPAVVELVGAPGAGKTTLLPGVLAACREAGLTPYTVVDAARPFAARTVAGRITHAVVPRGARRNTLWALFLGFRGISAIVFVVRHPRLARYVANTAHRRPAGADARARKVLHWYVRLAGSYRFLLSRGRADEALILDEGFVHRAVQLLASSVETPNAGRIDGYAALIPRPDLLIHVRAPIDLCEERVRSRGVWGRFDGKDPRALSRFVANAHRATDLIVDAARERGWPLVAIDNDGRDPAAAVIEAARVVSEAVAPLGGGVRP